VTQADNVLALGLPGSHGIEAQGVEDLGTGYIEFRSDDLLHLQGNVPQNPVSVLQDRQ
jgi:hypothetical protein